MKYILGYGPKVVNASDFSQSGPAYRKEVSQDVYDWLCDHDRRVDSNGRTIFIVNELEYLDMGPKISVDNGLLERLNKS